LHIFVLFFFFQAEDGIRDLTVTGVQTCALPIFLRRFELQDHDPRRESLRVGQLERDLVGAVREETLALAEDDGMDHEPVDVDQVDRKSTRLNSSHSQISYAVFCLKKKK